MPTIDVGSAMAGIRAKHPRFFAALVADAKTTAAYRAERFEFRGRTQAAWAFPSAQQQAALHA